MPLSETQALDAAREFVRHERRGETREHVLVEKPLRAERCVGGYGTDHLGLGREYWSFVFQTEQADGTVLDPDTVIVFVDTETARTVWFPTL
jgi:hypothetical protein